MKIIKSIFIWVIIIPVAVLNGGFRIKVLNNIFPKNISLIISGIILSLCIFIIAFILLPKLKLLQSKDYLLVGILWLLLTNIFEIAIIIASGESISLYLKQFDLRIGNTWFLVLLSTLFSPILVCKIKRVNAR